RADVRGPQTATVVGEGEIDCDEYGRILVRFHWDLDEAWSMRCRVSQSWAGAGWGGMVIPRIGMEVVVEFLDGDPDKPLVTGCVYNGRNGAPYELPEHKTKSVFRSDTHQGSGFNEVTFEDAKGQERIFIHAQKDHLVHVQNNAARRVDVSEVETIGDSSYSEVGKDRTLRVGGNVLTAVGVAEVQLQATQPMEAFDDGPLELAYAISNGSRPDARQGHYRLMVAQSRIESIGTEATLRVGHSMNTTVGTGYVLEVGEDKMQRVGGSSYETVGKGPFMHVQEQIDFRCGQSRFVMRRNGEIEITGSHIKINGKRIDLN
ncbi:type VI secretion system tip protein VgrG, partial [Rhodovulum sulfidophilum]|uniref:type VI secretion system Vgr family protein n=1 Tax=Rhodovulum sulfidophilum TaxID=35806 RepID=UPI001928A098